MVPEKLKPGDPAPEFVLEDQEGRKISLQDLRGKKVLLFFYPKAMTPGCTKQACSVDEAREDLATLGVVPLGISPDPRERQQKFATNFDLKYSLLSDPDHKVAEAYGVWGEKTSFGKKTQGIIRSAFLLDEAGRVMAAWYKIAPDETVPKVKAALAAGG